MFQMVEDPVYPSSDGKRMAENTTQYRWIVTIKGGLDDLFRDRPDVFVAADLLWYPVEGQPGISVAPDVMVTMGRPKGDRMSYIQYREDDIPLTVVFEVLSPSNTQKEMADKLAFYDEHGVREYVVWNPETGSLRIWKRGMMTIALVMMPRGSAWTSPTLGITLRAEGVDNLVITAPNGERFLSWDQLSEARRQQTALAVFERNRAELAEQRLGDVNDLLHSEQQRAEQQRQRADENERIVAEQTRMLERMREQMRLLGLDPDRVEPS